MNSSIFEWALSLVSLTLAGVVSYLLKISINKLDKQEFEKFKEDNRLDLKEMDNKFTITIDKLKEFNASIDKNLAVLAIEVKEINKKIP